MTEENKPGKNPGIPSGREDALLKAFKAVNPALFRTFAAFILGENEREDQLIAEKGKEYAESEEGKENIKKYGLKKAMEVSGELNPQEVSMNILKALNEILDIAAGAGGTNEG